MKKLSVRLLLSLCVVAIFSCTKKETTPPSAGETNAVLLAGAKGASKSWKLTSISESVNGGAAQTVTSSSGIPTCESDNIFTFTHGTDQSYQQTEGSTSCMTGDVSTIESGNWAFSEDGKSLFIEANVYPSSTQFSNEDPSSGYFLYYFILSVGKAWTVTQISDTGLTITYTGSYTDSNTNTKVNYTDTLVLAKN